MAANVRRPRFRQRPIRGGREGVHSGVEWRIRVAAMQEAERYNVSVSWLISTILADALKIDLEKEDRYDSRLHLVKQPTRKARKASVA